MGFAWIQPDPRTRYVALAQRGFVEVYEVAGGLPVRVASTTGVDIERSRATFTVSEHDPQGHLIDTYALDASVAG